MKSYHEPVLAEAAIEALNIKAEGSYVDATFGGGGHSRLILKALGKKGKLFAFDQDADAVRNLPDDERLVFCPANFRYLWRFLRYYDTLPVDGILADLGVSSHQLDEAERGFSFRFEAELDMRMNRRAKMPTAAELLNVLSAEQLQELFSRYGELRNARTLARAIVRYRQAKPIRTVGDFMEVVEPSILGDRRRYLSQVFQALRIRVNDELGALADFLEQSGRVLRPGGRLVVIAYHSLEDRLVKNFLKSGNVEGRLERDFYGNIRKPWKVLFKKPVVPDEEEVRRNPRARSAKMRAGEKQQVDELPAAAKEGA